MTHARLETPAGAPRPSVYDRWRIRLGEPRILRIAEWVAPLLITVLAGILRMWNLGHPHALVFDETYYVKDSWSQWNLGYSATWPDDVDDRFAAGETGLFGSDGSFVVHPPLGKWIIGAGMALFGADSTAGWRIGVAVVGTLTVLAVYLLARTLTGSVVFASVAGLLMAIDGMAIVMSRVALLDGLLTFFLVLAFWFVALDRAQQDRRAAARRLLDEDADPPAWGRLSVDRPWVLAAGAALGAASAVKWSGLYVLAAVGLYLVVVDALARRRAGVTFWPSDAVFRQGPVTFLLLVPIAGLVYVMSWSGWLLTSGGYGRTTGTVPAPPGDLVGALANLWTYHQGIYGFHVDLSTPHSYQSPAWAWLFLLRPTAMYTSSSAAGDAGCPGPGDCIATISSMPNPVIWFAGVVAVGYLLVRLVRRPAAGPALALLGVAATFVPWLLYPERTIFQFYAVAMLPFMILALTYALRDVLGPPDAGAHRRTTGFGLVAVFLLAAIAMSAFWYPILTAVTVPYDFWRIHYWSVGAI